MEEYKHLIHASKQIYIKAENAKFPKNKGKPFAIGVQPVAIKNPVKKVIKKI